MKTDPKYDTSDEELQKIDEIIEKYRNDEKELMKQLEQFKKPDGSFSLAVRWALDSISFER
ncbi:MAG: hypothetical protein IAE98_05420 [Candidatus Kapabacteria bacterium]|nr:hypothetical protein [Candidatus Kapabacteria bacterium]